MSSTTAITEESFEAGKDLFKRLNGRDMSQLEYGKEAYWDVTFGHVFGSIWTRPGLSLRDRSFMVCAALIVMGKEEELKVHLPGLLHQGVTIDEIREMILHLAHYGGWPNAVAARRALKHTMAERKKAKL